MFFSYAWHISLSMLVFLEERKWWENKGERIWKFDQLLSKLAQLKTTTMGEGAYHEVFEEDFLVREDS